MNIKTIASIFCFCVALYFGRLALQGLTSDYVCSMVHPLVGSDMEVGCVERHEQNFIYWKRVIIYSLVTVGAVVLGLSYVSDKGRA